MGLLSTGTSTCCRAIRTAFFTMWPRHERSVTSLAATRRRLWISSVGAASTRSSSPVGISKCYWQAGYACHRFGVPLLVRGDSHLGSPRSLWKRAGKQIGYRALLNSFDACLYVGTRSRAYFAHYGVPNTKLFHVPHFVDNVWFAKHADAVRPRRAELRAELGLGTNDLAALFVGRLVEFKRPWDLIQAAALSNGSRPVVPVFVGAGSLTDRLQAEAKAAGVRLILCGFRNQSELPAMHVTSDVFVLPSTAAETWGLVVNEAMASGLPAIVSEAAGCAPDMLAESDAGATYPVGDAQALARALDGFSSRLGTQRVADALSRTLAVHSCERAVDGTLAALHYVVSRRRHSRLLGPRK